MKVIDDDDDDFFSSTLIDEIALMLPCCQKLLPWISVTGHRHSGSRLYQIIQVNAPAIAKNQGSKSEASCPGCQTKNKSAAVC